MDSVVMDSNGRRHLGLRHCNVVSYLGPFSQNIGRFCTLTGQATEDASYGFSVPSNEFEDMDETVKIEKANVKTNGQLVDFTKIDANLLPTVILMGRPNVGKSALFNRLIRRREALVYNTPTDHVTRDIREGIAKLGDLRFRVLDSAGLEAEASSGSVLKRTAEMTRNVLLRSQVALFLIDARLVAGSSYEIPDGVVVYI